MVHRREDRSNPCRVGPSTRPRPMGAAHCTAGPANTPSPGQDPPGAVRLRLTQPGTPVQSQPTRNGTRMAVSSAFNAIAIPAKVPAS